MSEEVLTLPGKGVSLCCRIDGGSDGFPIVLLHGAGSDSTTWCWLTISLAKSGFRTIAPDLRGHGGTSRSSDYSLASMVEDIETIVEQLGVDKFAVLGHGLGGYLGLCVAQRVPDRVTGLVIEDPPLPPLNDSTAKNDRPPLRRWLAAALARDRSAKADREAVATARREIRRPDPQWWAELAQVSAPALVLGGGKRSPVNQRLIVQVAHRMADARWEVVPVGHSIHSVAKELFRHLTTPILFRAAAAADLADGFPD